MGHVRCRLRWEPIMSRAVTRTSVLLGLALVTALAGCADKSDPFGDGLTRTPAAEAYAPAYGQPAPAAAGPAPYDRISHAEQASIAEGRCDRALLASTPMGAGNQFVGGAAGPLVSDPLLSGASHAGMSPLDHGCVALALEYARDQQPVAWEDPASATHYQVTPLKTRKHGPDGPTCRRYSVTTALAGQSRRRQETACRLPGGLWQQPGRPSDHQG